MEPKKTKKADLEHRRPLWFLIGLVAPLLLLVLALELPLGGGSNDADADLPDDFLQESELLPAPDQHDMVAAVEPQAKKASSSRVNIVDEKTQMEKLNDITKMRTVGDGDANGDGNAASGGKSDDSDAQTLQPVAVDMGDNPLNFRVVEQLPEFPGGMSAFVKWLTDNLRYPYAAQQQKMEGRVVVSFVINRDGSTADIKIMKSAGSLLDREALRVARMMPRWKPGIANNKPCRTLFAIPIDFKI